MTSRSSRFILGSETVFQRTLDTVFRYALLFLSTFKLKRYTSFARYISDVEGCNGAFYEFTAIEFVQDVPSPDTAVKIGDPLRNCERRRARVGKYAREPRRSRGTMTRIRRVFEHVDRTNI